MFFLAPTKDEEKLLLHFYSLGRDLKLMLFNYFPVHRRRVRQECFSCFVIVGKNMCVVWVKEVVSYLQLSDYLC